MSLSVGGIYFVQACRVLSTKQLTKEKVLLGDAHLLQFCKRTQHIFGKGSVTPNMHMHCHLRSCIDDYGPLHGFWLYAFERYNGLLGAMPHNNHSIEVQIMNRFLRDNEVLSAVLPSEFSDDFLSLFPTHMRLTSGSLADTLTLHDSFRTMRWTIDSPGLHVILPPHCSRKVIDQTQVDFLTEMYTNLYKVSRSAAVVSTTCKQYSSVQLNGICFGTHSTRTASSSIAIAIWDNNVFGSSPIMPTSSTSLSEMSTISRAVRISSFCEHNVIIDGHIKSHLLVSLLWFKYHPKHSEFGKPTTVWYYDLFESFGTHSLIPVQFLQSRTVSLVDKLDGEYVLFLCPCIDA